MALSHNHKPLKGALMNANPMNEIVKRFEQQAELNRELWQEVKQLKFLGLAQEAAIRSLIAVAPDLERASTLYMDAMDQAADHISSQHIGLAREEYQNIHDLMLAEISRRSAQR